MARDKFVGLQKIMGFAPIYFQKRFRFCRHHPSSRHRDLMGAQTFRSPPSPSPGLFCREECGRHSGRVGEGLFRSLECTYSLSRRSRSLGGGAYTPSFGKGLESILTLGIIRLAGFARLAKCRHHLELEFLAATPLSLKNAFTRESERERAGER